MVICPKCGNRIEGYANFCGRCGTLLSGSGPDPAAGRGNLFRSAGEDELALGGLSSSRPGSTPGSAGPAPRRFSGSAAEKVSRGRSTSFRAGSKSGEKKAYAGPAKDRPPLQAGRMVKGLICLPIAIALIMAVVIFFEIDLGNMNGYVDIAADRIRELNMFAGLEHLLGYIAVYGLALMIILGAYILPARISKTIYKTCTVGDKVVVTIAGYFLIAFIIFLKMQVYDQGVLSAMFSRIFKSHGGNRLAALVMFVLLILLLLIPVIFIIGSSKVLLSVIVNNIKVNGPVLGIIAAVYELLSSVFVTALVLCAFSFGIAIILLPFIILAASSSGRRVVYDDYGNVYYING